MSLAHKGKPSPLRGYKRSPENVENLRRSKIGEKNPMWVGDRVTYGALHDWVKRRIPKPAICKNCQVRATYDLTNISGNYSRDLSDWEWLCRRCHMIIDKRMLNLKQYA